MKIAYLAPQLTALEATFIYEEIQEVESRGYKVIPFSVNRPKKYLIGHDNLLKNTKYLYDQNTVSIAIFAIYHILFSSVNFSKAIGYLVSDIGALGLFNKNSFKLLYQFLAAVNFAVDLKKHNCDGLHIHFAHVATQIGMYAAALSDTPFTVMAHANDIFERGLLLKEKSARADKFFTISEFNRQFLISSGLDADKVVVVRCGVEVHGNVSERSRKCEKKDLTIGTLGRLVGKKGIEDLLSALKLIVDEGTNLYLNIGGDGPLRDFLQETADCLRLSEHVRFNGTVNRADLDDWMKQIDVFVLACKKDSSGDQDGIPVVLMEAMARKVPVVSTSLSGIPELVIDEVTGLLANPNDPEHLSTKIKRCLDDLGRDELQENGYAHVKAEFGRDVNVERLLRVFDDSFRCVS